MTPSKLLVLMISLCFAAGILVWTHRVRRQQNEQDRVLLRSDNRKYYEARDDSLAAYLLSKHKGVYLKQHAFYISRRLNPVSYLAFERGSTFMAVYKDGFPDAAGRVRWLTDTAVIIPGQRIANGMGTRFPLLVMYEVVRTN